MIRDSESFLQEFVSKSEPHKSVLIVEGARQVGKTYLVESFLSSLKDISILSFNLERNLPLKAKIDQCEDFSGFELLLVAHGFKKDIPQILFIDEAQESQVLGSFVRFMKEEWTKKTVILSGSSMTRLFHKTRVPVGRVEYLRLYPYSFAEFLRAQDREALLDSYYDGTYKLSDTGHLELLHQYDMFLAIGGLPAVVQRFVNGDSKLEYENLRYEIFLSQEDDFYRKEPLLKRELFQSATRAVSNTLGFPFVLSRITKSHRDAEAILSLLEAWHICLKCEQRSLTPTSTNFHPKMYLYDVGLAKYLREIPLPSLSILNTTQPELRTSLGGLLENAVYLNLLADKGFLRGITGWKKGPKHQVEVDFVYRGTDMPIPIEVKASRNVHEKHFSSIREFLRASEGRIGVLVSAAPYVVKKENDFTLINLPLYFCGRKSIDSLAAEFKESQK